MTRERSTRRRFLATVGAALAGASAGCAQVPARGTTSPEESTVDWTTADGSQSAGQRQADSPYTRVYEETIDSVVLVQVFTDAGATSQGSGFVYDDGHVVTNQHVVDDAADVYVRFGNGAWESGRVVGTDVYSDLAVIRLGSVPETASSLELVDGQVQVGQEVVALGNPFGYRGSVSAGIVSGVDRTLPAANDFSIPDAIQTDAAVNPGNSGGPLVTLEGRVAGVINSGGGENIGFAISAALMRRVVPALIEDGEYRHSYMGVRLGDVTPLIAQANDLESARGVYIDEVLSGGPSDGVLQGSDGQATVDGQEIPAGGDVVVRMNDRPIPTRQALSAFLALETSPGETISVVVLRDGRRRTVDLTLGRRPRP